jgi:hypothetical protein
MRLVIGQEHLLMLNETGTGLRCAIVQKERVSAERLVYEACYWTRTSADAE